MMKYYFLFLCALICSPVTANNKSLQPLQVSTIAGYDNWKILVFKYRGTYRRDYVDWKFFFPPHVTYTESIAFDCKTLNQKTVLNFGEDILDKRTINGETISKDNIEEFIRFKSKGVPVSMRNANNTLTVFPNNLIKINLFVNNEPQEINGLHQVDKSLICQ